MSIRRHFPIRLIVALLLAAPRSVLASESYDNCVGFITSLPTVISTQGTWCLKQHLSTSMTSGNAIAINTNNVTIDCNNFRITGLGAGTGTSAIGISATNRQNIAVRQCTISGFYAGLNFTGGGHAIERNRFTGNTYIGLAVYNTSTANNSSLVQDNQVLFTGGSTVIANAYGIFASQAVDILGNTVSSVTARTGGGGSAYGIASVDSDFAYGANISDNRVRDLKRDGAGSAYGIVTTVLSAGSNRHVILRDNDLAIGGSGSTGLACYDSSSVAHNNIIHGFTNAISICADAGGNILTP